MPFEEDVIEDSEQGEEGEEGGLLAPTIEVSDPKPTAGKEGAKQGKESKEEPSPKGPLAERLQKAESAVRRHKETSSRTWRELQEAQSTLSAKEQALKDYQDKLAFYEERINRIKGGDHSVLEELGTSLETLVRRALDPEAAKEERLRRSIEEQLNSKMRLMEQEIEQRKQAEAEARYEQEVSTFLRIVQDGTYEDLAILEPTEQVAIGEAVAVELKESLGRNPKLSEVVKEANRRLAAYHAKVIEAHNRRAAKQKTPEVAEKPASPKLRRQVLEAPKPTAKQPPSTLTSQLSGQRGAKPKLSEEERRRLAVEKFYQNTRDDDDL
jgi:murein L,D-transpeptidase YcbB/YkuD